MQGPPSGVSLGDWFRAAVLPLPHPNIYQTPSHTIVSISGALWSAGLAGLLPSFPNLPPPLPLSFGCFPFRALGLWAGREARGSATQSGLCMSDPVPWPSTASAWSKGAFLIALWAGGHTLCHPCTLFPSPPPLLRCSQPLPHPFLLSLSSSSPTSRSYTDGIQMCIPVPILAVSGMSYYLLRLMSIPDSSLPTLCSPYPVAVAVSLTDFGPPKPKASTALRLTPSFPYTQYIARPQYSLESSRRLSPPMRPSLCAPNPFFSVSPHVHRVCGVSPILYHYILYPSCHAGHRLLS